MISGMSYAVCGMREKGTVENFFEAKLNADS